MTITSQQISKTIGQVLVLAALVAYWAPAVSYVSHKLMAGPVAAMAQADTPANTTIAYEVMNQSINASQLD